MYSFFVLGIVPGTNIQITFTQWLVCLGIICELICVVHLVRRWHLGGRQPNFYVNLPNHSLQKLELGLHTPTISPEPAQLVMPLQFGRHNRFAIQLKFFK